MANSDFRIFAGSGSANTLTAAEYAALTTLLANGFQGGTASSQQFNTLFRQCSAVASMIAGFAAQGSGNDSVDDGTIANLLANFGLAVQGRLINIQSFTTAGSFTYTPTPGTKSIVVKVQGGGGGGGGSSAASTGQGSAGAGGAGGGYAESRLTTEFTPTVAITIGAGGTAGAANSVGGTGGTTSFGSLLTATGGSGGPSGGGSAALPAVANGNSTSGVGTGGNITNALGGVGLTGVIAAVTSAFSCGGGSSYITAGAPPIHVSGVGADAPSGSFGSGGGGGLGLNGAAAQAGGAGMRGSVYVYEYA
jgi:hypothetical protein